MSEPTPPPYDPEAAMVRWHAEPEAADMERAPLEAAVAALEAGRERGQHPAAQLYVSRAGRPVLEYAAGDTLAGHRVTPDSLMAWFSACKPLTAMTIAWLYDRGRLDLDDRVQRYLPAFANGKETCTVRHVLTHQGGFPNALGEGEEARLEWDAIIERICAAPAEYAPGSRAGYHHSVGWYILGELVRVIDGRPIDRFVTEELCGPLGMVDSHMGIPAERREALDDRLVRVARGVTEREPFVSEGFVRYWNGAAQMARVHPGGGMRGPARELGRFYEWMLARGRAGERELISRPTAELFVACHRWGLPDHTLMNAVLPWALGFGLHGNADLPLAASRRVYGHSGMVCSVGMADPERELACVVLTSGLLDPLTNARRLREVTTAAVKACRPV